MSGTDAEVHTGDVQPFASSDGTEVHFELHVVTGPEGTRIAREQTRAIEEVLAWLTARKQSEHGRGHAV